LNAPSSVSLTVVPFIFCYMHATGISSFVFSSFFWVNGTAK
jgi:hypothetical protein